MTFNDLHEGHEFDCLQQNDIDYDLTNLFVRGIHHQLACVHSFNSNKQDMTPLRYQLNGKYDHCRYRCVSINLLSNNKDTVRQFYEMAAGISPKLDFPFLCVFRVSKATAKIWNTASKRNPSHRSMVKADQFDLSDVEIVDIISRGSF